MSLRVLLTDADTLLLSIYRTFLVDQDIEVRTASTALECLEELRQWRPDVLVLDVDLLWGSGLGVLALMREDPDVPVVPVLLLAAESAVAADSVLIRGCTLLFKPVPTTVLVNAIRALVRTEDVEEERSFAGVR